jgi:uncharacterized protein (TIGR03435 family)
LCTVAVARVQNQAPPAFEVASIKRHLVQDGSGGLRIEPGGRTVMTNQVLLPLITMGYPLKIGSQGVKGIPAWMRTQTYDVITQRRADATVDEVRAMWRDLLEKRMKFAAHYEIVEQSVFVLVNGAKGGAVPPQLTRSRSECDTPDRTTTGDVTRPSRLPNGAMPCGLMVSGNSVVSGGSTMAQLAQALRGAVGGAVSDRTGIGGRYVFSLNFTPANLAPGVQADSPSIFRAVQEQLGLKIETEKEDVQILMIDHVEPPSEN